MAGPIRISVLANASQAKRELNSVAGVTEKSGSRIGSFAKKAGAVAAAGLLVASAAAVHMGTAVVKSASDSQQSLGATETVFGKYADQVVRQSKRAATSVGLSANEYRESSNLIGALFKNQGVAADKLAGKTANMVRTGADLAATYGGTTKEAVEALGSAFKGEFDPLERYGISIKQSTINAELAARGQDKLTGAALRAAQQQATAALITKQAGGALGSFGREANTFAGQQQRLTAGWENIKAKIGTALLPAFTQLFTSINKNVLPAVSNLADKYAPKLGRQLGALAATAGPKLAGALGKIPGLIAGLKSGDGGKDLGDLSTNLGRLATGAQTAAAGLPSMSDAFKVSNVVIGFAADHIGTLTKLLPVLAFGYAGLKASQLAANVVQTLSLPTKIAEVVVNRQLVASNRALIATRAGVTAATTTETAAQNVSTASRLRSAAGMVAQRVALVATSAATKAAAAAQWLLNSAMFANPIGLVVLAIIALAAIFVMAWKKSETFRKIVTGAWNAIKSATSAVWGFLKRITSATWSAIKSAISLPIRAAIAYVKLQVFLAKTVVTGAWNFIKGATTRIWNGIKTAVRTAITGLMGFVRDIPGKVKGIFTNAGSWLLSAGKKIIGGLLDGISSMIGKVKDKLSSLTSLIPKVKGPARRDARLLRPAGRLIIGGLVKGMDHERPKVQAYLRALTRDIQTFSASPAPASLKLSAADAYASIVNRDTLKLEATIKLSAAQIAQLQRGREIRADLDAFDSANRGR